MKEDEEIVNKWGRKIKDDKRQSICAIQSYNFKLFGMFVILKYQLSWIIVVIFSRTFDLFTTGNFHIMFASLFGLVPNWFCREKQKFFGFIIERSYD